MKQSVAVLIGFILISSIFVQGGPSCSASAAKCDVSCSVSAPPNGSVVCEGKQYSAECYAFDELDDCVMDIVKVCPGVGGGGGGGPGDGPDEGYCAIFPFWCIPMY